MPAQLNHAGVYAGPSEALGTPVVPEAEERTMDLTSLFGGVSIGRDTSGNFKMAIAGKGMELAVRTPSAAFASRETRTVKAL